MGCRALQHQRSKTVGHTVPFSIWIFKASTLWEELGFHGGCGKTGGMYPTSPTVTISSSKALTFGIGVAIRGAASLTKQSVQPRLVIVARFIQSYKHCLDSGGFGLHVRGLHDRLLALFFAWGRCGWWVGRSISFFDGSSAFGGFAHAVAHCGCCFVVWWYWDVWWWRWEVEKLCQEDSSSNYDILGLYLFRHDLVNLWEFWSFVVYIEFVDWPWVKDMEGNRLEYREYGSSWPFRRRLARLSSAIDQSPHWWLEACY